MDIFWAAFFGCLIAFFVCIFIGEIIYVVRQKNIDDEEKEELCNLLTEFDEMGYVPTTLCSDPEKAANDYKTKLKDFFRKIIEN